MEPHTHSFRSGVVFDLPPPNQFVDPLRAVNSKNASFSPPFSLIDPCVPQPPSPPPPSWVLVPYSYIPPTRAPLPSLLLRMDQQRSASLFQFMTDEGLVPSPEEEEKRRNAIQKLKEIVSSWIKKVAWQRRLPKHQIDVTSATVLTYGSYGLGVHSPESDIDALCVAPFFASIAEDFFVVLYNMLKRRPEISEIYCVKRAKVPLMRFKLDGISIDLPYARLKVLYVPQNVDILNPFFLRNIDDTSWKSLSGVRANKHILQLVPNVENFQSMLRCFKLWAKRRGVYGTLLGYLGGVHLAVLAAYVCQRNPDATLNALMMNFFRTFAFWPWPRPVMLQEEMLLTAFSAIDARSFMPIWLPSGPYEYCHSNITKSTFCRIRAEFLRGYKMTKDLLKPDFIWASVFDAFPYSKRYSQFVKIYLSAPDQYELGDWVGWVKSRFRGLVVMLEEVHGFCDPNPTEYVDTEKIEPNMVFYWGLHSGKTNLADIDLVEGEFMKIISNGYEVSRGRMELSILLASQLPKNAQFDDGTVKGTKTCWKIIDYDKKRIPEYPQHLPNCLVGYVAPNGEAECLGYEV